MRTIANPVLSPARRGSDPAASATARELVSPADAGFDEARRAWNLSVDQRPAAVVFPRSADEVVQAVLFARENGLRVAAQGTGHNAAPLGSLDDTLLVKTERMRDIRIDPEARIARVEAGVLWQEVVEAAAQHGLAGLQGSSPDVGVVGYTLGGGMSFMGRKHGLAANRVRTIELVTAEGRLVRTDRHHEPELFWALRGGGGSFGVVTALEFELFPSSEIYAGILWYPVARAGEVLHAWRELTHGDLPEELTTVGRILHFPPVPDIPEPIRGQSFVVVEAYHLGEPDQADELLTPLRMLGPVNDTIERIPMPALSRVHMDPDQPVPGIADGALIAELPAGAVDSWVEVAGERAEFPLLSVQLRHLEGEFARARPENGALAAVTAKYVLHAVGITPVRELEQPTLAQIARVKQALAPYSGAHNYLNFAEEKQHPGAFWPPEVFRRLQEVKTAVDPADVIRANHPVPPSH